MTPRLPSRIAKGPGGRHKADPSAMTTGATATMPSPSDLNHANHSCGNDADDRPKIFIASAAGIAAPAAAIAAAHRNAATLPRLSSRGWDLSRRSKTQPKTRHSSALQIANAAMAARLDRACRLATTVAATTASATGHLDCRPNVTKAPAASPDAGQTSATLSGWLSSVSPNPHARKYATPTTTKVSGHSGRNAMSTTPLPASGLVDGFCRGCTAVPFLDCALGRAAPSTLHGPASLYPVT